MSSMNKYLKWLLILLIAFVLGIVGYFVVAVNILSGDYVNVKESFKEYYDKRNELVQLVETYQLEYDENGLITNLELVGLSGLAFNDKVYVRYQEEKVVVDFVINAGMPDEGQSIFYSSGGEELIREKTNDTLYAKIEKLEDNWYFVQYN